MIALAGVAAGAINTVVGSGTLITFPTLLAASTPNDGAQTVSAGTAVSDARVRVRCLSQPFFNVNPGPFAIGVSSTLFANGFE